MDFDERNMLQSKVRKTNPPPQKALLFCWKCHHFLNDCLSFWSFFAPSHISCPTLKFGLNSENMSNVFGSFRVFHLVLHSQFGLLIRGKVQKHCGFSSIFWHVLPLVEIVFEVARQKWAPYQMRHCWQLQNMENVFRLNFRVETNHCLL